MWGIWHPDYLRQLNSKAHCQHAYLIKRDYVQVLIIFLVEGFDGSP